MKTIGITGGVGAGKSTVLDYLENKYGAKVYKADAIAHFLEEPGEACYNKLVSLFGNGLLDKDNEIDRITLADLIFNSEQNLKLVNSIIHPEVKKYVLEKIKEEEQKGTEYFILEAALLIEDGYQNILDEIWYIHTDVNIRRERLKLTRGYSDAKIDGILQAQLEESVYRKECKYTIDNSKSEEETRKSIDLILGR